MIAKAQMEEVSPARPSDSNVIKVLLVDDDQDAFLLTRHHLSKIQSAGPKLQLDWSATYESGLEEIKKREHNVYLLDYRLGARNGLELLKEALAFGVAEPIIMLTAENPLVDAEAMQLGAADFLNKDRLDPTILERSIRYSIKHFATLNTLKEREAQLAGFMQNVPCAVSMKDLEGRYLYVNEAWGRMFQKPIEDWPGRTDEELFPKGIALRFRKGDANALNQRRAIESTETLNRPQGELSYWLLTRFPILNENGEPIMLGGAAIDITNNKRLEREVQEVSEQEKRRIGQDLHDGLGQYLTGIACMVKVLEQKLGAKEVPEANDAKKITNMVNETIQQARELARGLCPVELERNGLHAALQELANRVEKLFHVKCVFKSPQVVSVYDNAMAVHLYRIAQEGVNNAMKHGSAQTISIGLSNPNGQILLTVKDDGCGVPKDFDAAKGMGLRVMNYRAGMIGASVTVENSPEGGCMVKCVVPYPAGANIAKKKKPKAQGSRAPKAEAVEV
ncbi:MAG TPA: PAS domain-containing protein [Methylomirabilota bacterium]|nr:PAS domain-containing protein [Methylomirabilota bacterium]